MAVKVIERTYSEIYTPGTTDWLLGNVGAWQKLNLKCEASIEYVPRQESPIEIDRLENAFVLVSGQKWGDYGFDTGMTLKLTYDFSIDSNNDGNPEIVSSHLGIFTIKNIYGSVMEVEENIVIAGFSTADSLPINSGTNKITNVLFYSEATIDGCHLKYGHITNDDVDSNSLFSFIDGTETQFSLPNLNAVPVGTWSDMEPVGLQSGMSIRSIKVRELSNPNANILGEFIVPIRVEETVQYQDKFFGGGSFFDSARSLRINCVDPGTLLKTVTTSGFIPQNDSSGGFVAGLTNQAFLYNSPVASVNTYYPNVTIQINQINRLTATSTLHFKILKYSGGPAMNYVGETILKSVSNVGTQQSQFLNCSGQWGISVGVGESLVFAIQLTGPQNQEIQGISYTVFGGQMYISQPGTILKFSHVRNYEFQIEYMISSLFENLTDLENKEQPSYLIGDGSLTDNYDIQFFPEWNNPNVFITNDMSKTQRLGNTGWFNENFNELPNDFNIKSVKYFDINGNVVETLDYTAQTKVQIVIEGVQNLNASTECGFGFAWIPTNDEDFKNLETPFYQNCFVQSGDFNDGFLLDTLYNGTYIGAGVDGGSMDTTKIKFTKVGNDIVFEATFIPNGGFFNIFDAKQDDDRNFVIWVSVADSDLARNFSDRVALLADVGIMQKSIPQAGEYDKIENSFIEHQFDETSSGDTDVVSIVQDDLLCRLPLRIPTDGSKIFQRITFGIEAFNIGEDRSLDLESYQVDLTQYPITIDGVQQIQLDTIRGFKLESGNNKNFVKIYREPAMDSRDLAGYLCFYGFKIRWEDWIAKSGVPSDFYDATKLNNGSHNDWVDYFNTIGWNLKFYTEIVSEENGDLLEYKNRWDLDVVDYDKNINVAVTHKYFRDSDNTLMNVGTDPDTGRPLGVIISNEPTRIEIEFEILDAGVWNLATTYAVTTIEIERGPGIFEQRQLSSVWGSENDNPLIPVAGETKLKLEVDGTNKFLKTSCLVDPDLLVDATKYRITGRVGCKDDDGTSFDPGLYEYRYENKYE